MPQRVRIRRAYICGPLTELPEEQKPAVKKFYEALADTCQLVLGVRAFVPHEHYDPKIHAHFTPEEVDQAERRQVCERTSVLIVAALAPSWGGGIEVEMANQSDVPVILLWQRGKSLSRLLRGNPAVKSIIEYDNEPEAINKVRQELERLLLVGA